MTKRLSRTIEYVGLFLPVAALLWKNWLLQGYIAGYDPYALSLWEGFCHIARYLPWHLAVCALLAAPLFLFKDRGRFHYGFLVNLIATVVLFIDLTYYRCYNTLPGVSMLSVAFSESGSDSILSTITSLFVWSDLLLLIDWPIGGLLYAALYRKRRAERLPQKRRPLISILCAGVSALVLAIVPLLSLFGADEGLTRRVFVTADLLEQSRYLSSAGAHLTDAVQTVFSDVTKGAFSEEDEALYEQYFEWKNTDAAYSAYSGAFAGQNLLILQVESLESFVLGQTLEGQEVTPNLNRLIGGGYYFPHIYEQVKSGNSSDCDFMVMTGLLPTYKSYAFGSYTDRKYRSLQALLKEEGDYTSYYFHGAANATWNYEEMLTQALGVDHLVMDYEQEEQLNSYLSDESFVSQTLDKISADSLNTPFYAHLVTCSSHIPCDVPEDFDGLQMNERLASHPMGRYLQSIHYTDRQIGVLLDGFEKQGLLENTLIAVIGDHAGVHKYYPHRLAQMDDKLYEDWFSRGDAYTLPFILYHANITQPQVFERAGGQVDIMPTLLSLLGIETPVVRQVLLGRDLFSTSRSFAMRDTGVLYGSLPDEEVTIAEMMFYLSDRMIRSGRITERTVQP